MPVVWPAQLPQDSFIGHIETAPEERLRTGMDVGPPKMRRRFTAGVRNVEIPIVLTTSEATTLMDFYTSTLTGGVGAFDWKLPRTGATVSFRFVAPPKIEAIEPNVWRTALSLEILP